MIKFPLIKEAGTNIIVYPDNHSLFENVFVEGDFVVANYTGNMVFDEYTEPPQDKFSSLAFMDLIGDANMITLLTEAKTNPVAELMVKKIERANIIDFSDEKRGPQIGLGVMKDSGLLSESEYTRIMNREYPE